MSSSLDTSSSLVSDQDATLNDDIDDISGSDAEMVEIKRLTRLQERDAARYRREIIQSERNARKWTKTQVNTVTAIKEAEVVAKRYELDRLQAEFQTELANKEVEIDTEMREIDAESGELRGEVQALELELSEIKEQRKRALLAVRTDIATTLDNMRQKEVAHTAQIQKLQNALLSLTEKHAQDIHELQNEGTSEVKLIEMEIQRVSSAIERYRKQIFKSDDVQGHRMGEAAGTVEMMKNEIAASNDRAMMLRDETQQTRNKLTQLQQNLCKAEEQSRALSDNIAYSERQKQAMKGEIAKLDRSLWSARRRTLIQE